MTTSIFHSPARILFILLIGVKFSSAWFEQCDHTLPLGPNASMYVNSPYYPNRYPPGSSCRYTIVAPADYEVNVQCTIRTDKFSQNCDTELFYISVDGDKNLRGSEFFCGEGYFQRKSIFNKLVIAYTSGSQRFAGAFQCYVTTTPQPCDCGWSVSTKITGGVEAKINEYPFMAAIFHIPNNQVFCSASIISHRYLLTAAHCFSGIHTNVKQMLVVVGEHDLRTNAETPYTQRHYVQGYKQHEYYDGRSDMNDIALVYTATDIEWSRGVGPICLPFLYSFAQFDGKKADIAGWGTTSFAGQKSPVLMKATVDIISNNKCQSRLPNLKNSQMCTYSPPKDSCQFDSGGPLIVRFQRMLAVGIISYGSACGVDSPGVNTRITAYLDWIQSNTRVNFCRK